MPSKLDKPRTAADEAFRPDPDKLSDRVRALFLLWGVRRGGKPVRVEWNPRLRTTAGRAHVRKRLIELNPHLLSKAGRAPEWLAEVLTHEAAHLAAVHLHGRDIQPHGEEWRALMEQAGAPARACHQIDVDGLRRGTS